MSAPSLRSTCLAVLTIAAASGSGAAQEMVPLELVQSLSFLNPMGGGTPELRR